LGAWVYDGYDMSNLGLQLPSPAGWRSIGTLVMTVGKASGLDGETVYATFSTDFLP
jgi:hypothetical protein